MWQTILIFGALFAASVGYFVVQVVSICENNLTGSPSIKAAWISLLSVALPIAIAVWLFFRDQEDNRPTNSLPELAPVIVAWIGIGLTMVGCLIAVSIYLSTTAVNAFNTLIWETEVSPSVGFHSPSFAVFYGENDTAYANFSSVIKPKCYYPAYNYTNCIQDFVSVPKFHSQIYGDLTGYFFDGSTAFLPNLSSKVLLTTFVNYNSQDISAGYGGTGSPQNPYLYFAIFDPALNISRFKEALDCGVVALSEMAALGSTSITVTPYAVSDTLNALNLTDDTCLNIYDNGQSHLYYTSQPAPTGDLISVSCDTNSVMYNPNHDCISQVILRYGTNYLTTFSSRRQKRSTDILIDIGGIVGGVCFAFWFLGIFAVTAY